MSRKRYVKLDEPEDEYLHGGKIKPTKNSESFLPEVLTRLIPEINTWVCYCKCGYRGKVRNYRYEALEEIMNHFKKNGTLMPDPNGRKKFFKTTC